MEINAFLKGKKHWSYDDNYNILRQYLTPDTPLYPAYLSQLDHQPETSDPKNIQFS